MHQSGIETWKRHIKKKLGIEADWYSLKHLHTTEIAAKLGAEAAAEHNAHTTTAMVNKVYDVGRAERERKAIQEIQNAFA